MMNLHTLAVWVRDSSVATAVLLSRLPTLLSAQIWWGGQMGMARSACKRRKTSILYNGCS